MAKISLLERMIIEGRLNNVEKKFPLLATKHNGKSLIDRFSKEDPSGNNKYLAWMTDAFFEMLIRYAGNMTGGKGFEEGGNIGSVIQQIYKENLPLLVGDEPYPKTGFVEHAEKIIEAVSQFHTLLPHIKTKDIYLCDSGGQYHYGTTDVTRTMCFSKQTNVWCPLIPILVHLRVGVFGQVFRRKIQ